MFNSQSTLNARSIIRSIGNFLFSRANRELLIFLFFFAIAGVFWLLTSLNETYEQEVKVVVRYVNVPKEMVLTSPETDTLRLSISDKGINIVGLVYGQQLLTMDVDFSRHTQSDGTGTVSNNDLLKLINRHLPTSAKLLGVKPEKLSFYYNNGEHKQVPVRIKGTVRPEKIYFISDTIQKPDSITIYALRSKLDSINEVYTETLNYTDFGDTLRLTAPLQRISGVKLVPDHVQYTFVTDILTEESIDDVPIVGINMPEGKRLRTFPAKTTVRFVTGMKNYQHLSAKDFLIIADYDEFANSDAPKCNIYVKKYPKDISRIKLDLQQVDYLIEERPVQ